MKTALSKRSYFKEFSNIVLTFVFWGAVLPLGTIYVFGDINNFTVGERQLIWLVSGVIFTGIYVVYRRKKYFEKEVWSLNKDILSRGEPVNTVFDLKSIEYITFGVPKLKFILYIQSRLSRSPENFAYGNVLTLKFNNGKYLILDILQQDGGLEILSHILEKYQEKIVEDYVFSEEEKMILKLRSTNRVLTL